MTSTDRLIRLEGASNFRDLGGYPTRDGRHVHRGRVYRADSLARLTARDRATVAALGIGLICDFRYGEECRLEPSPDFEPPVERLHLGLPERPERSFLDWLGDASLDAERATEAMLKTYRAYPELYAASYRVLFERILAAGERAVLFHCTAGKDRTGFAAALLLSALGVPEELIEEDYLLTNTYWQRGDRAPAHLPREVVEQVFGARREYLHAAFAALHARHGTVENYLREAVGFADERLEALRRSLLE